MSLYRRGMFDQEILQEFKRLTLLPSRVGVVNARESIEALE
jgi:hypothetical protein